MAFVALMWLAGAAFLFIQGVYVLRTGQVALMLAKPEHRPAPRGLLARSAWACFYLSTSLVMTALLANKIEDVGLDPLKAWLDDNFGMLFWSLMLAVVGIFCLWQPANMLRWTIRNYPRLAGNRSMVITVRLIGLGILGIALTIMIRL